MTNPPESVAPSVGADAVAGQDLLPRNTRCPGCWYELAGITAELCPECGGWIGAARSNAMQRNIASWELPGTFWMTMLRSAGIVAVMSVGAGFMAGEIWAGLFAALSCSAALGGSVVLGALAASTGRPGERRALWSIYCRTHWWLHGPWLCMPACAALLVLSAWIGRIVSWGSAPAAWVFAIAAAACYPWFIGSFACVGLHLRLWRSSVEEIGGVSGRASAAFAAAKVAVLLGSMLLGLLGGLFATLVALDIASDQHITDWH